MQRTVITCDCCGREIDPEKRFFSGNFPRIEREKKLDGTAKERICLRQTDLCQDCGNRVASSFIYIDVPEEDYW